MKDTIYIVLLISFLGYMAKALPFDDEYGSEGTWQTIKSVEPLPDNAIRGGVEEGSFENEIFVGRWWFDEAGGYIPGYIVSERNIFHEEEQNFLFTYNGPHRKKPKEFEILVKPNDGSEYKWVKSSSNATIPDNTVIGGYNKNAEMLYVGRYPVENGLIVGKVSALYRCIFVFAKGMEIDGYEYEILVRE